MKNKFFRSEKALFATSLVEIFCLIIFVFLSAYLLRMQYLGQENFKKASQLRYDSYLLADQLRQSSDDLTRMVRSYVASNDSKFENYFWDIINIRDGKKSRPINYERVYWDFMTVKKPAPPFKEGEKVPLERLMREAGFTEKEFQLLADAKNKSDKLVSLERVAMHAMKGKFQDGKGEFSINGEPDPEMARQIVFGEEYHDAKMRIMEPINEFLKAIDQRTSQTVAQANSQVEFYQWSLFCVFGALILNGLLLLLTTNRHQKLLVGSLKTAIGQLSLELTERELAEKATRKSEEKYRRLVESLERDYFMYSQNTEGVFTYLSPSITKVLGYTQEEFLEHYTEYLTDDPVNKEVKRYHTEQSIKGIQQPPYEVEVFHKDGGERLLEVVEQPIFDEQGSVIAVEGIAHDITDRKQAEETFQAIVQSTVGRTGQDFFDNICSQLCKVFNSECTIVGELAGPSTVNAIAMVLDGRHISDYTYQLAGTPCEKVTTKCFCHYSKDVSLLFPADKELQGMEAVGYVGTPLTNRSGTVIGVLCVISKNKMILPERAEDLMNIIAARTSAEIERMKAEREKEKLEARLQQAQKMEAIGTLAGGIAHDFNNILAAILGYSDMAREDSPSGSTVAEYLDKVLKAGDRAKGLVQQILAFSRQDYSKRIPLQPAIIVKESIKMLRPTLPSTIEINQNIDPKTGFIFSDPTQIHQILMNLFTNAFHAMEEMGGRLDVSLNETDLSSEDLINEPSVEPGTFVQLSICDSGSGIAPEIKDKIFDPYFTTKEIGKGTGMGLSIVHGIVNSCGGFISFYSELGKGTAFHVFLPAIKEDVLHEIEDVDEITGGKERVLFIDDEEILAEMGKDMLERLGYHVTVRNSSLEALETFQNQPGQFDIVITDQTMPGMTGADLSRRMMQIRPDIPIILCTGYSSIISEEKAKSIGIKEFALKPLAKKDIARLIRKVLDAS